MNYLNTSIYGGSALIVFGLLLYAVVQARDAMLAEREREYTLACMSIGGKPFINSVRWACYVPGHYPLEDGK